ncbi:hypothetical protein C8R47DRAFT_1248862 [Mycena vitilis]|nr:hypothetical protein C8R47DRAFT_1248862 [Mycena vitilis]
MLGSFEPPRLYISCYVKVNTSIMPSYVRSSISTRSTTYTATASSLLQIISLQIANWLSHRRSLFLDIRSSNIPDRPPSPQDSDSYTDSNSLEEVEASLNDLDDELEDTQHTVSLWSSSYTGSPSFVSLPSLTSPPPILQPYSSQQNHGAHRRVGVHDYSTDPRYTSLHLFWFAFAPPLAPGLPPPGRATELIAVFEAEPARSITPGPSHTRVVSSSAPFFTPAPSIATPTPKASTARSGARVTTPLSPSRTRPSMSTLLSQPPISTASGRTSPSGYTSPSTRTDTDGHIHTIKHLLLFVLARQNDDEYQHTDTNYDQHTNTINYDLHEYDDEYSARVCPQYCRPVERRLAPSGSPKDSSSSLSSSSTSKSADRKSKSKRASGDDEPPLPALPIHDDGLFGPRARTPSLRRAQSASLRSVRASRHGNGAQGVRGRPVCEERARPAGGRTSACSGNVHAPPPFRRQRCQALLYPHLLLLSWLAPGGRRGIVGLDLISSSVQSTPSLGPPAAREDVGTVAAREQSGVDTLAGLLVPFQMVYEDSGQRLAAESLFCRDRSGEAVHCPLTLAESSAGSSVLDADESVNESESAGSEGSKPSRTASIRKILSVDSAASASSIGSNGCRSTVFVPPLSELPEISGGGREGAGGGVDAHICADCYPRTPSGTRTVTGSWTPTGTHTSGEFARTETPTATYTSDYTRSEPPTGTCTFTDTTGTGLRRAQSLVSSHHTGTVADSVIANGEYVYPGDPRAITGRGARGRGGRRASMGEVDLEGSGNGSSDDVFLSADSRSAGSSQASSGTGRYQSGSSLGSGTGIRRSGTLLSHVFSGSPIRTTTFTIAGSSLSDRGPGSASMLGDSHSDYSGSQSDKTYSSYSYASGTLSGTGTTRTGPSTLF